MSAAVPELPLLHSRLTEGVATLTLNRPARLNAFAEAMRDELADELERLGGDPAVRCIVVTGAGRAFCAGADVEAMAAMLEEDDEETFRANIRAGIRVVRAIAGAPKPVIAAVNGAAVGAGASLAAACDLRIASEEAQIGFTFNRIGLHPDWGATYFLPRLVGEARAAELIFSARILNAGDALDMGIFEHVAPARSFEAEVETVAASLSAKPPIALRLAKSSFRGAEGWTRLEEALRQEEEAQLTCFRTADVREGVAAFREKRPARFTGR